MTCTNCFLRTAVARGVCICCYHKLKRLGMLANRKFQKRGRIRDSCEFTGPWPKVRLTLTPEDVFASRGVYGEDAPLDRGRMGGKRTGI